jgi:hypothetical protein
VLSTGKLLMKFIPAMQTIAKCRPKGEKIIKEESAFHPSDLIAFERKQDILHNRLKCER